MEESKFDYPPVSFHFRVEFKFSDQRAKSEINFQEVSGLNKEMTTEDFTEGGENRFVYRFPKGTKYPNLVLKRGMKPDSKIIDWARDAIDHFDFQPVDITVTLLNPDHNPLVAWEFVKCWPLKWATSDFKGQDNAIVIETLELNYNYYTQKKV
ncbi:phage tail protein [Segetibacter aerophilus]|uniref:Phage tail protein n=1 Tax=Segetibacter aerophilus TaxID=670293 RepID=A0A512BJ77_9BACT|nr:phage tail protein [Segetibacter aerophilus]GEO11935.1 phage tail protein [Segetibacter aerophilus]